MGEDRSLEDVIAGGLDALLNPAGARRVAGVRLPIIVAERLAKGVEQTTRDEWARELTAEFWPAVHAARGTKWDLGWDELTGGLALSIELLGGELPSNIRREIDGTPAEQVWRTARRRFQRFVLVVDSAVDVRRVFVPTQTRRGPSRIEESILWSVDGARFRGRSHTIMLALMADGALVGEEGPVAATGELLPDGESIGPVESLVAKAEAWWEHHPAGLLITHPPGDRDPEGWSSLLNKSKSDSSELRPWIVGASLSEIRAKLEDHAAQITSWDGSVLEPQSMLRPRLTLCDGARPSSISGDVFFDACWMAWREAQQQSTRRGVVVHGSPGSGKSVFSLALQPRFLRGALGALGYGVRRAARDLAADLEKAGSRTWAAVLAVPERDRLSLYETLDTTNRLVPIIDGLDELQPDQLRKVSEWLAKGRGWWLATSRPIKSLGVAFPSAHELRIDDLYPTEANSFLTGLGRGDLARSISQRRTYASTSDALRELTRTPLQLALLARVVSPEDDISLVSPSELYERAFNALLEHACRSERIRAADVGLLNRLRSSVAGEMGLAWLRSPTGMLTHADIDKAFAGQGMSPDEQARAITAMEFGHLLVPTAGGWEFGHRTLAEWAAAAALRRRVDVKVHDDDSRESRAAAEVAELDYFLADGMLAHQSRWSMLLRFYAPALQEPLALLERLIGPNAVPSARAVGSSWGASEKGEKTRPATSSEVLAGWPFAFDLMRTCHWTRDEDAQAVWALGVRRWLLGELPEDSNGDGGAALRAFATTVGEQLPETLGELVEIAARTPEQRNLLYEDPLTLLPAVPAVRAPALAELLATGTRGQQLAILNWHHEHSADPPREVLEKLAVSLPEGLKDIAKLELDEGPNLEAAVWRAYLDQGCAPPWGVVRRRFNDWPSHLKEQLVRWFGSPLVQPDAAQRRRELFAALLVRVTTVASEISACVGAMEDRARQSRVLRRVRYLLNDKDARYLQRLVDAVAAEHGWSKDGALEHRAIDEEETAVKIRENVALLHRLRARAASLVRSLDAVDEVVGELWNSLPPTDVVRREILFALESQIIPRQISAEEILRHYGGSPSAVGLPEARHLSHLRWTDGHLRQLRQLSLEATGRVRYLAVCAVAHAEHLDEVRALQPHLPSDDEVFSTLVYDRIASRNAAWHDPPDVPDPSRLPLAERAALNVPGWRAELYAGLADPESNDLMTLVEVAVRQKVPEAMRLIAGYLGDNSRRDLRLVEAIDHLVDDDCDEEVARVALRHALRFGWPKFRCVASAERAPAEPPGTALARFLRVDDLDLLAEGVVSALDHPSLARAIGGLGEDAFERLLELHRAAKRGDIDAPQSSSQESEQARKRRDALAGTILASVDASRKTPSEMVSVIFEIASADVHNVYSMPGALGSDFDDPGDVNWYSDQVNESLTSAAREVLEAAVAHSPDEWSSLRRLFDHPSESLRKWAFEMCADRAQPHEIAELALEALDGHLRENRTEWTGQTSGLTLAALQSGAGVIAVSFPDTQHALVAAVRGRLTPAHQVVVRALAEHENPLFRALAAKWSAELGDGGWLELVTPLLDDDVPGVVSAAVGALASMAPAKVENWLLLASTEAAWEPAKTDVLLRHLVPPKWGDPRKKETPPQLVACISQQALVFVLSMAEKAAESGEEVGPRNGFQGFPSLVEEILEAWPHTFSGEALELFHHWSQSAVPSVRSVGRRILAANGVLDVDSLEAILRDPVPAERFSGAECVVRMGVERFRDAAVAVLSGALADSPDPSELRAAGLATDDAGGFGLWKIRLEALGYQSDLRSRLLWALRGAPASFVDLLTLVAGQVPFDQGEGCLEEEGEQIVEEVTSMIRRWGSGAGDSLLKLMDEGGLDDVHPLKHEVRLLAEQYPEVLACARVRARDGGASSAAILSDIECDEFERDLVGLARQLSEHVFPADWAQLLAQQDEFEGVQ